MTGTQVLEKVARGVSRALGIDPPDADFEVADAEESPADQHAEAESTSSK